MTTPLLRAQHLLALTSSSSDHEARSAAALLANMLRDPESGVVLTSREEAEVARGMLTAYENCVVLAREEYQRLLGIVQAYAEGKPAPKKRNRKGKVARAVEASVADAAGDIIGSALRGAFRRL